MRTAIRGWMLLASMCMMTGACGWAQQSAKPGAVSTDGGFTFAGERSQVIPSQCCFWFKGGGADAAVTFWKGLGVAAAVTGDHAGDVTGGLDVNKIAYLAGPRYTWTSPSPMPIDGVKRRYQVFAQGLFGGVHGFNGYYPALPTPTSSANAFAVQAGGGVNLLLWHNWGVRLIEADYVRTTLPNSAANAQNDMRLSAGIVYHHAPAAPPPLLLSCSVAPAAVFAGDPVTATATAQNLNPKLNAVYNWEGAGASGSGAWASVATDALAPGDYTIHCGVKQGAKGKEGLKPGESATSEAHFTVKPFETPTVSCMADPVTIKPGETSTITAKAASPQNRPRSFSYEAQAGAISGTGSTVEFNSAGAPTGVVGVTCKVTDDKGQQAMAATSVTIVQPYVPPAPHTEALCSQSFAKDAKRPASVDNEAKACLDQVALALEKQADARAAVVGHSDAEEQAVMAHEAKLAAHNRHVQVHDLAAERAVNAKDYLVKEKGIDAARITPATSAAEGQTAEDYLVPAGANFAGDVSGTTAVDENAVRPILEPAPRHVAKKAAKQP